ncbi:hypothetical protein MTR05_12885 [Staphylococcus agnetis]|uniref:hypothetical protein n=1 Tax=Staphylococcus agnetis TaxID=985762 RepID=UPI00208FA60C|nr:hypothetical protein [Staphylococcus agnetis]MCO4327910.1 hypothetical protein [Staphylococcus agnetis]
MTDVIEKYVSKKHRDKIESMDKDIDGWWINLKEGYVAIDTGAKSIHEYTVSDIKKKLYVIVEEKKYIEMSQKEINEYLQRRGKKK